MGRASICKTSDDRETLIRWWASCLLFSDVSYKESLIRRKKKVLWQQMYLPFGQTNPLIATISTARAELLTCVWMLTAIILSGGGFDCSSPNLETEQSLGVVIKAS